MTTEKSKDYARGYSAGRKRTELEVARQMDALERHHVEKAAFARQVFLASLPAFMAGNWQSGGKKWSRFEDYVKGVSNFARQAADEMFR